MRPGPNPKQNPRKGRTGSNFSHQLFRVGLFLMTIGTQGCHVINLSDGSTKDHRGDMAQSQLTVDPHSHHQRVSFLALPKSESTHEISFGPEGNLWITQQEADRILFFDRPYEGKFTVFHQPKGSKPHGIVADETGAWVLWQHSNALVKIDKKGKTRGIFKLPAKARDPHGLARDQSGRFWFASKASNTVGWLDPQTGAVQVFQLRDKSTPIYLHVARDNSVWFTQLEGSRIGRIRCGELREIDIPTVNSRPITIKQAPDGSMWFTEESGRKLGRISPSAAQGDLSGQPIEEIPVPSGVGTLAAHHITKDGAIWVQHNDPDQLLRFKNGHFETYSLGTLDSLQHRIIQGPEGDLWFTELKADRLGRFSLSSSP